MTLNDSATTELFDRDQMVKTDGTVHPAVEKLREQIDAIGLDVLTSYTLADAIREGSSVTGKLTGGWVNTSNACALGAGYLAAQARGYVKGGGA